jgi:hypothetical protein
MLLPRSRRSCPKIVATRLKTSGCSRDLDHPPGLTDYADALDQHTTRQIWPIELTFGVQVRLLAAWCELREDFRSFRVDRIISLTETSSRYPKRRRSLLRRWRQSRGVSLGIV